MYELAIEATFGNYALMWLHWQANTEVTEQALKHGFLVRLGYVVGLPILRVGDALSDFDSLGQGRSGNVAIGSVSDAALAFNGVFNSKHMLAFNTPSLMIWARARVLIQIYGVLTVTRLTRNNPCAVLLRYVKSCCYLKSSLFSAIHCVFGCAK